MGIKKKKRLDILVGGQTSWGKMQKSKLQTSENFPAPSHHFHILKRM